jgi:hypothetical protein
VASLPVASVSLYKNGVGFFQHTGHITGNATVTLDFNSGQLNDVLQSLTAIDLNGGRIAGAGYNSTTPLDQQLKALSLGLGEDPTAADFYGAIRGTRVEVHSGTLSITGRLLSMETKLVPSVPADDSKPSFERSFITVVSDTGEVRTLELTPTTSVHLLDTALHTDVTRYLQLLDANRSQGLRHLTLTDNGTGPRELQLSYISEVPIWKSTYRILFTEKQTAAESQGGPFTRSSLRVSGEPQKHASRSKRNPHLAPLRRRLHDLHHAMAGGCRRSRGCSIAESADGRFVVEATMRSLVVVEVDPWLQLGVAFL